LLEPWVSRRRFHIFIERHWLAGSK
jgi:hypothetical protein